MAGMTPVLHPGFDLSAPDAAATGYACVFGLHVALEPHAQPSGTTSILATVSCGYQTYTACSMLAASGTRSPSHVMNEGCAILMRAGDSEPLSVLVQLYDAAGLLLGRAQVLVHESVTVPDPAPSPLYAETAPAHQAMTSPTSHSPGLLTHSVDAPLFDAEFWGLRIGSVRALLTRSRSAGSPPELPPGVLPMRGPFLTAQTAVRDVLGGNQGVGRLLAACGSCLPASDLSGQAGVLPPISTPGSREQPIMVFNRHLGVLEEEFMPPRLLPAMRFLYNTPVGRGLGKVFQAEAILTRMTLAKGLKMDSPQSAADIPGFLKTFHGHVNLSEVALPSQPTLSTEFTSSTAIGHEAGGGVASNGETRVNGTTKATSNRPSSNGALMCGAEVGRQQTQQLLQPRTASELARAFPTFNHFFFRGLRPGCRPVAAPGDPRVVVSAADCRLIAYCSVEAATEVWVKGRAFRLVEMLGGDARYASVFAGGPLLVFRLCPQDYHRFHCPVDGVVEEILDLPGAYLTVNPVAITEPSSDPLGRNRRAVAKIRSDAVGQVAFVPVGATFVGSIRWSVKVGQRVSRGQELGLFAFGGSTVVVVFEAGSIQLDSDLVHRSSQRRVETLVRMGEHIGVCSR